MDCGGKKYVWKNILKYSQRKKTPDVEEVCSKAGILNKQGF